MGNESVNRLEEHFSSTKERAAETLNRCSEAAEKAIKDYPLGVAAAVFAAGMGLGVLIGNSLSESPSRGRRETAEHVGRRILDSISDYLPESIQRQLHS